MVFLIINIAQWPRADRTRFNHQHFVVGCGRGKLDTQLDAASSKAHFHTIPRVQIAEWDVDDVQNKDCGMLSGAQGCWDQT